MNIIWFFSTFALNKLKMSLFFPQVAAQKIFSQYISLSCFYPDRFFFYPVDFTIVLQFRWIMKTYSKMFLERPALFLKMSFIFSQVLLVDSMGLRRAWKLHTLQEKKVFEWAFCSTFHCLYLEVLHWFWQHWHSSVSNNSGSLPCIFTDKNCTDRFIQ